MTISTSTQNLKCTEDQRLVRFTFAKNMILEHLWRFLGVTPVSERMGLKINLERGAWVLEGETDLGGFLEALPILVDSVENPVMFLEGAPSDERLKPWIRANEADPVDQVPRATIWPRCEVHHIPLSAQVLEEMAALTHIYDDPAPAYHMHIYRKGQMILEWHDAFDNVMLIHPSITEAAVVRFASVIGFTFEKQESELQR